MFIGLLILVVINLAIVLGLYRVIKRRPLIDSDVFMSLLIALVMLAMEFRWLNTH